MRLRRFDSKSSVGKGFQEEAQDQGDQIRTVWLLGALRRSHCVVCCTAGRMVEYEVGRDGRGGIRRI